MFYSQREQVLASDKKRTCFANNRSDLKPRVKAEVSVCSFRAAPARLCARLVKWSPPQGGGKSLLGFPFTQEDLSPKATPRPRAGLSGFVSLCCRRKESGASFEMRRALEGKESRFSGAGIQSNVSVFIWQVKKVKFRGLSHSTHRSPAPRAWGSCHTLMGGSRSPTEREASLHLLSTR